MLFGVSTLGSLGIGRLLLLLILANCLSSCQEHHMVWNGIVACFSTGDCA
uniref:Uncharacterized protein n=1 Tax=Arundo donax TaxID=35708 RepID=A0A0A9G1D9_ARUDO